MENENKLKSKGSVSSDCVNDDNEKEHFRKIVDSFRAYQYFASKRVAKSLKTFHQLPETHQNVYLNDFEDNCKDILKCIDLNNQVIELILEDVGCMFENAERDTEAKHMKLDLDKPNASLVQDVDRVITTFKQIVRDWSSDGAEERKLCYGVILDELKRLHPNVKSNQDEMISVLVPGAGLGRLAFEIALLGYKVQGNEFSLHMLITSNFIINKCDQENQYKIYPYVNNWCNNLKFGDQTKEISFPDISPFKFSNELDQFSMTAGDFLEIYNEENEWNCVVTSYFIDTAHNVIDYIEKIWKILKPNGYWINFGPLLYHFSDMGNERSIELSYEQIKKVIQNVGFNYVKEETKKPSTYLDNKSSMLKYIYECVFFVVQKPSS